ncbi:MAG: YbhB/YbcL family Raf kinase inhibitor-like protein, partial [Acidimicrobiales bacterium]
MLRRRRAVRSLLAGALAAGLVVAACSSGDGRALPPPGPDQTTTTPSAPVVPETDTSGGVLDLTSAAFADGQPLPERFTCTGEDVSPDLAWTAPPAGTVELALVVRDQQEAGFVHWVVAGVEPFVLGFG